MAKTKTQAKAKLSIFRLREKKLKKGDLLKLKRAEKKLVSKLVRDSFTKKLKLGKRKKKLVMNNFPLAIHFAKKYIRRGELIEDLVQVAVIGLIKAVVKYKQIRNIKLATYAAPTIEGELRHYIRDKLHGIKISRKYVELNAKLQKFMEAFIYNHGREATRKELSEAFGLSPSFIDRVLTTVAAHFTISLDSPIYSVMGAGNSTVLARLEDICGHESEINKKVELLGLEEALRELPARNRRIIKDHFFRGICQDELAKRYRVTQAQISRILKNSCKELEEMMN